MAITPMTLASARLVLSSLIVPAAVLLLQAAAPAQIFGPSQTIPASQTYNGLSTGDIDGDGDIDLVATFDGYPNSSDMVWIENLGAGQFGASHKFGAQWFMAFSTATADIGGDGDLDVLAATPSGGGSWYEGTGGGSFLWFEQSFPCPCVNNALGISAADVDGDGDADVLVNEAGLSTPTAGAAWYENLGGGSIGPRRGIAASSAQVQGLSIADVDGDGLADVVLASKGLGRVVWRKNLGGEIFSVAKVISGTVVDPIDALGVDMDGDGDIDVLTAASGKVTWFENLGAGASWTARDMGAIAGAMVILAEDFEGDGDLDVVVRTTAGINSFEGLGGGAFAPAVLAYTGTSGIYSNLIAADLDTDGDLDLVFDHPLGWIENIWVLDCNGNGQADHLDLAAGTSADCDGNGIPDECDLQEPGADIDGDGQLDDCVAPPLMADVYKLSVAAGGTQAFTLTAPTASDFYLLLGTTSGSSPGTPFASFLVPLNVDGYFLHTLAGPNTPPLTNSLGNFTPSVTGPGAQATAAFTLPPALDPGLIALTLRHAYVTLNPTSGLLTSVSNAVPILLTL
jgi:hypothetical protein